MESHSLDSGSLWRLDTFIVPPGSLTDRVVPLAGDEFRHALAASRTRPGDMVRLIDGEGAEVLARLEGVEGAEARFEVLERRAHRRDEAVSLTIVQALPKGRGMDDVVRRCSELGVDAVVPVTTDRTIVKLRPEAVPRRVERWRALAASAAKQSRGVFLTRVLEPTTLSDVGALVREADLALVAWEEEGRASLSAALRESSPTRIVAVVGPEGGLDESEIASLKTLGARPVGLGRRVLRSDWAAAALAAVVANELGGLLP